MALLYNKCYLNSNDVGCHFFRIWVVCFVFEFINVRPGRDFINVRGLLIQGGDYIYIYVYIHTCITITTTTTTTTAAAAAATTTTTTTATTNHNTNNNRAIL